MNLKQMEYFVAIVNEGNISAAAKSLHISQPPLSAQMRQERFSTKKLCTSYI